MFVQIFFSKHFFATATPIILAIGLYISYQQLAVIILIRQLSLQFHKIALPISLLIVAFYLGLRLMLRSANMMHSESNAYAPILAIYTTYAIIIFNGMYQGGNHLDRFSKHYKSFINIFILLLFGIMLFVNYVTLSSITSVNTQTFYIAIYPLLLLLYVSSYAYIVIFQQKPWLKNIGKINFTLAWIVIIITIAVNNPLWHRLNIIPTYKKAPFVPIPGLTDTDTHPIQKIR